MAHSYDDYQRKQGPVKLSKVRKHPPEQESQQLEGPDSPPEPHWQETTALPDSIPTEQIAAQQAGVRGPKEDGTFRRFRKNDVAGSSRQASAAKPAKKPKYKKVTQKTQLGSFTRSIPIDHDLQFEKAKRSAVASITLRVHYRRELRNKLLEKGFEEEVADRALDRMEEVQLLDDSVYAEIFVRTKWERSKWSPSKIGQEMRRMGLEGDIVDTAIREYFYDQGTSNFSHSAFSSGKTPSEELKEVLVGTLKQKMQTMTGVSREAQLRRLVGWLQRRGHGWDVISEVLQEVGLRK